MVREVCVIHIFANIVFLLYVTEGAYAGGRGFPLSFSFQTSLPRRVCFDRPTYSEPENAWRETQTKSRLLPL